MEPQTSVALRWEDLAVSRPAAASAATPGSLQASYLTHELRAPVTAIRLCLEIIREGAARKLAGDEQRMLSLAIANTSRLEGLINDIMDYSKLVAGKMTISREPCEARALVNEAMDGLRTMALAKGVKLVKEVEEGLPRVSAEPRRVIQVLTNLIANAIKFTPPRGTVLVSARSGRHDHAGTVLFRVKDTGCGIPAEDIDRIFEVFAQAAAGGGKHGEGTGLGLTLARAMVELHGGRIWAESWEGAGASFYFTIPVAPEDMPRRFEPYAKPVEYHGLLVDAFRRLNAFLAMFF